MSVGVIVMIFPAHGVSAPDYGAMAQRHVGGMIRRKSQSAAQRLRICGESFSELGFLMLIAYQLGDAAAYYTDVTPASAEASAALSEDGAFDFVAAAIATDDDAVLSALADAAPETAFDDAPVDAFAFSDVLADPQLNDAPAPEGTWLI